MFYTLKKLKREGKAEARRGVVAELQAIAEKGTEAETLQRILDRWEQKGVGGQAN